MHPAEMLGEDWYLDGDWGIEMPVDSEPAPQRQSRGPAAV